ncbi:hypothetical protein OBBRIDRAFT_455405 [Obba rivulosa]|uniref:Heterokaryon incompatibility domain-containing protein n=1 Tax=Obba rivulosa TaxID=1052685 RepID=A0A8E2B084_9APHY|nr:hypothetical protein OBBRIDRAFT_455405 [Obba rivulosa]
MISLSQVLWKICVEVTTLVFSSCTWLLRRLRVEFVPMKLRYIFASGRSIVNHSESETPGSGLVNDRQMPQIPQETSSPVPSGQGPSCEPDGTSMHRPEQTGAAEGVDLRLNSQLFGNAFDFITHASNHLTEVDFSSANFLAREAGIDSLTAFDDSFETFKAEFRDCLDKLMAHLLRLLQFTDDVTQVAKVQIICSLLSGLSIFYLPPIDSMPNTLAEFQHALLAGSEMSINLYSELLAVANAPSNITTSSVATFLDKHKADTATLFRQLLTILAIRYGPSAVHTPILESVNMIVATDAIEPCPESAVYSACFGSNLSQKDTSRRDGCNPAVTHTYLPSESDPTIITAEDAVWLGAKHDGFELCSVSDYRSIRYSSDRLTKLTRSLGRDYLALLQSQLTFGLIEAVVREKIPESLLLQHGPDGTLAVTTRNLYPIIDKWVKNMLNLRRTDIEAYKRRGEDAWRSLCAARAMLDGDIMSLDSILEAAVSNPRDFDRVARMISIIGETLTEAVKMFEIPAQLSLNWAFPEWYRGMSSAGWCRSIVSKLSRSICSIEYANTVAPFIPNDPGRADHTKCTNKVCAANTIDLSKYSNRHVEGTCECPYSKPFRDEVLENLANNEIPLIVVKNTRPTSDDGLELHCTNNAHVRLYVAISHVWADGLGSTTEVGLPMCQVRRLATLAHRLVPGGALWLDGLCIPEEKEMRKRAIGLMGRTYRDAHVVLVIDAGIRSCSTKATIQERLLRVVTSGWAQRMWTLQEALMAEQLVFEFADGLTSIQELFTSCHGLLFNPVIRFLLREMRQLTGSFLRESPAIKFGHISSALEFRTTSKPEDETLAIASLFNVSAFELATLAPEERMRTLLLKIRDLPSDVVFLRGPKLSEPGFRWAPSSFMSSDRGDVHLAKCDAICTEEGLLATCKAIRFEKATFRRGESWWLNGLLGEFAYLVSSNVAAAEYTCNALLLKDDRPTATKSSAVAALIMDDEHSAGHLDDRLTCKYLGHVSLVGTPFQGDHMHGRVFNVREISLLSLCLT